LIAFVAAETSGLSTQIAWVPHPGVSLRIGMLFFQVCGSEELQKRLNTLGLKRFFFPLVVIPFS
jgi:hypothetical protein